MNLKSATVLMVLLGSGAAYAQTALDPVLETLRGQGYSNVEITRQSGQVKIEARNGTAQRELVYDAQSGKLLSDEANAAGRGTVSGTDDPAGHDANDDRAGSASGSDDPAGHDAKDDHGGSASGSDDAAGHDANDDHGGGASGSDRSGSGHSGGGSDDSHGGGSDDSGHSGSGGNSGNGHGGGHGSDD